MLTRQKMENEIWKFQNVVCFFNAHILYPVLNEKQEMRKEAGYIATDFYVIRM